MSPTKISVGGNHYFMLEIKFGACPQDFGNARIEMLGLPIFYPIESTMETKGGGGVRNRPRKTIPSRIKYYTNKKDHHRAWCLGSVLRAQEESQRLITKLNLNCLMLKHNDIKETGNARITKTKR